MKTSTSPSHLEAHLGYWLRLVSNHVSQAFAAKLAAREVLVVEWVVLRELYGRDDVVPSDLATRLGMTRGGISKLVNRLETGGLITRIASSQDRRYQALTLTRQGKALVPRLAALADQNEEEFFSHLPSAKRAALHDLLTELVAHHGLRTVPIA
jgi:DNA-binding MarR family transcriptional regulator